MKRLDNDGEGSSAQIGIRLPQKTTDLLDALIASLPPHPIGPPSRSMVLRAVIEAGIEALAIREGITLGPATKPINERAVPGQKGAPRPAVKRGARARASMCRLASSTVNRRRLRHKRKGEPR